MRMVPIWMAAVALTACHQQAELKVTDAWIRLPAAAGRPGAAYFTVRGGAEPTSLVAVSAPFAVRAELHESMAHDGMMSMQPIRDVAVPANGTLSFAPGGKHVMLFDIAPNIHAGETAPIMLDFANGKRIEARARIVGAGDPAPQ